MTHEHTFKLEVPWSGAPEMRVCTKEGCEYRERTYSENIENLQKVRTARDYPERKDDPLESFIKSEQHAEEMMNR